ncbi:MAG: HAMP domain-containing histidine kinase [Loktanella sp.]|nr:HAMP domain-containing histidine kinase [Loktanella sp.]
MKSYVAWLHLSLFCVGLPAVVFAWLGWQLSIESSYRVERGRIASDIYSALTSFDLSKAQLRIWSYEQDISGGDASDERRLILGEMENQAAAIADKTRQAIELDQQRQKSLQEHQEREALLNLLQDVIAKLESETAQRLALDQPDLADLAEIDAEYEQIDGLSLTDALSAARRQEAVLLAQERARADESLTAARQLFLSAGAFVSILTVLLAVILSKRLRTPLRRLSEGVQAYQSGDFSYRLADFRDAEFSTLAQQLNAMASEVKDARTRATEQRLHLENTVAARTTELRAALDDLSATDAARKQLLADIGHELRTPVTVLQGEAQVALRAKEKDSAFYRDTLERIVTVARQMGGLIEDLIEVVRNPAAQVPLALQNVALPSVISRALDTARSLGAIKQVTVAGPAKVTDITLTTDPDRLHQVLVCLLDNAIRYSHERGIVTLACTVEQDRSLSISVIDHGIGIDVLDIPAVWDRGWRAQAARAHRPEGLGLGLAIARQLAHALGGTINIDSAGKTQGTTATLRLPLSE